MVRPMNVSGTRAPRPYALMAVVASLLAASCSKKPDASHAASDTTSLASRLAGGPVPRDRSGHTADTVLLAEAENSRAYDVKSGDSSAVVWSVREPTGWRSIWRSRDLLGAAPTAKLQDVNGDGAADLFWSIDYEGLVGGMVVLRSTNGVTELWPDVQHCLRPEMQTINNQHLIVAYLSGAYSSAECEDPPAQVCLTRFQIAWPQFYRVEGQTLVEFRREPAFYRDLSERYRKDASELQRLVDSEREIDEAKQVYRRCPPKTPQRMRKLADSALALVQ